MPGTPTNSPAIAKSSDFVFMLPSLLRTAYVDVAHSSADFKHRAAAIQTSFCRNQLRLPLAPFRRNPYLRKVGHDAVPTCRFYTGVQSDVHAGRQKYRDIAGPGFKLRVACTR